MNFQENSLIQSVLYRPNIQQNLGIDRKFMKRKQQIFQTIHQKKNESKQYKNNKDTSLSFVGQSLKQKEKLQLPDIFLYSKRKQKQVILIEDKDKLIKEISTNLNFVNKKISIINTDLLSLINEPHKSLSYESQTYKSELRVINEIFSQCGINLKNRDVLILEGQRSKTKYSIFTSHPKHPQSLCCKFQVIIKHLEFVSPKYFGFDEKTKIQKALKSIITISCLKCKRDIIKILPSKLHTSQKQQKLTDFQQQKKMINLSKLISSGRFKKTLINDESITLMKSRNLSSQNRSKTSFTTIKQISQTIPLKLSRYTKNDRENRVKSQQMSMQLKQRLNQNKIGQLIGKRKNNASQIQFRKDEL